VITGRMAQLYIVSRLWKVKPQFAVEQRTRLLRMLRTLFSRYIVWGYQSNLDMADFHLSKTPFSDLLRQRSNSEVRVLKSICID